MIGNEDFEKLLKLARHYGVAEFDFSDVHVKFLPENKDQITIPNTETSFPVEGMPTEDEMLLWSTNFMPSGKESK